MEIGQKLMAIITNNLNTLEYLELSIQVSLSGLSFCVLSKNANLIIALKDIKFSKKLNPSEALSQLIALFDSEPILQNNFNKVLVIHDNELSTFVPDSLFDENKLSDYLKYNAKILKSDFITYDRISINNSVNVYMPYVNINNFIYDKFGEFTYNHVSSILVEQLLHKEFEGVSLKFFVNVNSTHFEIIVINKGTLIFYNTFNYTSKEDFIYYILFTIEQLELDPNMLNLFFLGDIDPSDDLYKIVYNYIRFVFLGTREDSYKYGIDIKPVSNHSNFALIKSF